MSDWDEVITVQGFALVPIFKTNAIKNLKQ